METQGDCRKVVLRNRGFFIRAFCPRVLGVFWPGRLQVPPGAWKMGSEATAGASAAASDREPRNNSVKAREILFMPVLLLMSWGRSQRTSNLDIKTSHL
jgi:hypothetical protein